MEAAQQPQQLVPLDHLERALALADDVPTLKTLHDRVAACQELVSRMNLALAEQNRVAEIRIRVARKLGSLLHLTVRRGGSGSNCHRASSKRGGSSGPLPAGISWSLSSRLQKLAAIPEEFIHGFLRDRSASQVAISLAGLLRAHGRSTRTRSGRTRRGSTQPGPPSVGERQVWEAIRCVLHADVAVGFPAHHVKAATELTTAQGLRNKLSGVVVARVTEGPGAWVRTMNEARTSGRIPEAVLILPAQTTEPWFRHLAEEHWVCCFLSSEVTRVPTVVGYVGERKMAFAIAFRPLGTVLETAKY